MVAKIVSVTVAAREVRVKTRCSMGCPAMSARIFPGKREEDIRPWMMAITLGFIICLPRSHRDTERNLNL